MKERLGTRLAKAMEKVDSLGQNRRKIYCVGTARAPLTPDSEVRVSCGHNYPGITAPCRGLRAAVAKHLGVKKSRILLIVTQLADEKTEEAIIAALPE